MTKLFFSSDHHFHHKNIIEYCNRPFSSIEEMDAKFVDNWNEKISPTDHVYYLGDFGFARTEHLCKILSMLNGIKFYCWGNHDKILRKSNEFQSYFQWCKDYAELKIDREKIVMSHYPFLSWNGMHHGTVHLHGHCHNSLPVDPTKKRMDVGVDAHNYYPISLYYIKEYMSKIVTTSVDHHIER